MRARAPLLRLSLSRINIVCKLNESPPAGKRAALRGAGEFRCLAFFAGEYLCVGCVVYASGVRYSLECSVFFFLREGVIGCERIEECGYA